MFDLPQRIVKLLLNIENCIVCEIEPDTEAGDDDEAGQAGPGGRQDGRRPGRGHKRPRQSHQEE